jgi:putative ABC transport system permease protein
MPYAIRRLLHDPGFGLIVVLTLALGIGANTAIFSIVDAVLLRPLPYSAPDRLITANHFYPSLNDLEAGFAVPSYADLKARSQWLDSYAVVNQWGVNLTGNGEPERLQGARVTGGYFRVLGVSPLLGRTLAPGEDVDGKDKVVVLSHGLWTRLFGADPGILGRKLVLNSEPYDVVGVMPSGFRDFFSNRVELWAPAVFRPAQYSDNARTNEFLSFAGRLKPGIPVDQARREMSAFAAQLKADHRENYPPNWTITVKSFTEVASGRIRPALLILLGAVGLVLLIACANIANLLLARGAARAREMAVRTALGATRGDIVRQLMSESLVLAFVGATLGLLLAFGAVKGLVALNPTNVPRVEEIGINGTVLLFTLSIALITGLLFGIVPAIQASRTDPQASLREGGRGVGDTSGQAARRVLVVAEVALALTLLVGAGLLLRSFAMLQAVSPGFDASNLMTMSVSLPNVKYPTPESRAAFFEALMPRIAALPGVVAAGATSNIPFGGNWSTGSFDVEGYQPPRGEPSPWGDTRVATRGFHEAMRMRLIRGRLFAETDRTDAPRVVVVDEELARRYWSKEDPIGKRITFGDTARPDVQWVTVIGVVQHTAHEGLDAERRVQLYLPYAQRAIPTMTLAVRTAGEPHQIVSAVRGAVRSVDRDQPIAQIRTMDEMMETTVGQRKLSMYLLTAFAGIALLLSAIGIYGVMSFDVTRRSQEMGVRMALGAARGRVLAMILRQGMVLAAIGVVLGLIGAFAVTRVLENQLFGITPSDPATFGAVAFLLCLVALVATLVPALRATRVDPAITLRYE